MHITSIKECVNIFETSSSSWFLGEGQDAFLQFLARFTVPKYPIFQYTWPRFTQTLPSGSLHRGVTWASTVRLPELQSVAFGSFCCSRRRTDGQRVVDY